MTWFRYPIFSKIRTLLLVSVASIVFPIIYPEYLLTEVIFPVVCFTGATCFFLNFPIMGEYFHHRPLYIEDLREEADQSALIIYHVAMSIILACAITTFIDYSVFLQIFNKSLVEFAGTVGGILTIYMRVQIVIGKLIIHGYYCVRPYLSCGRGKRKLSDTDTLEIEMVANSV